MPNNRFYNAARHISSHTVSIMNIILPFLLAAFLRFAVSFCISASIDPLKAFDTYSPMIEYLMMSLLLTLGGGVIFDIAISKK